MSRRKWLARGLVLLIAGGLAAAGLLYQRWTNPAAVRQQVLEQVAAHFVGVHVSLESARLRLLGGIAVRDLRLCRRDDLDRTDFAYFPSAVIYHDKEQLLDGRLAVRKLELHRPRLRVIRGRDGRWNLAGILGPVEPDKQLPTIVMQQATVVVEDQSAAPGTPPIEVRNVHLTLINDPLPTVAFEGTGTSDVARTVRVRGKWQRATGDTDLTIELDGIPVGPALVQRLSSYGPELAGHLRQLEGIGKLEGELHYYPGSAEPWAHDFRFHLSQGKLDHARLPLPLEDVQALLHIVNGEVTHGEAAARAGPAQVELTVKDLTPGGDALADLVERLDLRVKHLQVTRELFERLPPELQEIREDFRPQGTASLTLAFQREPTGEWQRQLIIQPEDVQASCSAFPYLLEHITGTIEHEAGSDREERIKINLVGRAGSRPVYIKGEVAGPRGQRAVHVDVWGDNLPLDEKLLAALPPEYQPLARSFHATGQGDFRAFFRRGRGAPRPSNRYLVYFHHAALRYDGFPYPLENVSGTLEIQPDHWEFRDFRGSHKGGEFRTSGRSFPGPDGDRLVMDIRGINMLLDEEMAAAMAKEEDLRHTWKVFAPGGRIDFEGRIVRPAGRKPDIDLTVYPRGCTIRPEFFPYLVDDLRGKVRYARRWVHLEKIRARHGDSRLGLDEGLVYLKPEGGVWARLVGLHGDPLVPDLDFLQALPPLLGGACRVLNLKDPLRLHTELVIDSSSEPGRPPVIYWDGVLGLRGASLEAGVRLERVSGRLACRGRHNGKQLDGLLGNILLDEAVLFGQPLHDIHSQIEVTHDEPDVLRLPGLRARLFGGEIYGPARVEFGPTIRYELNLTAAQVRLEEFGRHNLGPGAELQGLAAARLYLTGQGADIHDLKGSGSIDVPQGKMYNLPLLLDLLKVLGLRLPDRTAFEEAHATFTIEGPVVHISRLDLLGNAISLRGQGRMDLYGNDIDLDFHADWARLNQMLPPVIDKIPTTISNQLLRINMRGRIGDVRCTKEPVPLLMDPIKKVIKGPSKGGRPPPKPATVPEPAGGTALDGGRPTPVRPGPKDY